jgi:glycosyltransferase involved in cell wall biosynthesis
MKVLLLSQYDRLAASSRLRALQYIPRLRALGIDVMSCPLLSDQHLDHLYRRGVRCYRQVITSYIRRIYQAVKSYNYDLVWLQGELLPWFPAWGEQLFARMNVPYIVDYDDAVFHKYDLHPNRVVRAFLKFKIDVVMRRAALVIVGNDYLAERALRVGARRVQQLPTAVDLSRYVISQARDSQCFTVGWIGSPVTRKYLEHVGQALSRFCNQRPARLVCIGSGSFEIGGVPLTVKEWSEETEVAELAQFDVGIMPLQDGPWERGKCGYKLVQYMACGLPVIASPVGANSQIVRHGINGYLASTTEEWIKALMSLNKNAGLRNKMGLEGRRLVETYHSLDRLVPRLESLFWSTSRGRYRNVSRESPVETAQC